MSPLFTVWIEILFLVLLAPVVCSSARAWVAAPVETCKTAVSATKIPYLKMAPARRFAWSAGLADRRIRPGADLVLYQSGSAFFPGR